jgi:hypothetical protein
LYHLVREGLPVFLDDSPRLLWYDWSFGMVSLKFTSRVQRTV